MIPLEEADTLPPEHRTKWLENYEHATVMQNMKLGSFLTEKCFTECVHELSRKDLDLAEEKCVAKCCEKYMKSMQRISITFAALNADMERDYAEKKSQK